MNFKKVGLMTISFMTLSLVLAGCGSKSATQTTQTNYPTKSIKIINILPAGTPPDTVTRKLADIMSKKYNWKFDIVNVPQNGGADAVNQVWNAPHDGYTVLGQTENMLSLSVLGLTKQTTKDWDFYEMTQETTAFVVKADSPYKNIKDIVEAAKAKPETIKIGARGVIGSSFNLKIKVLETVTGAQFVHRIFESREDIMGALENGSIDAVVVPAPLAKNGINDGNLRVLATADGNSYDFGANVGMVDSVIKTYPDYKTYLPLDIVPGLAMPADVPKDIKDNFGKAFEKAMNSPEMDDYISKNGSIKINLWGDYVRDYMNRMESNYVWVSNDMGIAKVSPDTLGIQKPKR